jgi:hypothetical protein
VASAFLNSCRQQRWQILAELIRILRKHFVAASPSLEAPEYSRPSRIRQR